MSAPSPTVLARRVCALLAPLEGGAGAPAPADVTVVDPRTLPELARTLLVHEDGLTPTLERHLRRRLDLAVLAQRRAGSQLRRHVHLVTSSEGRRVSFGALWLELDPFSPEVRGPILASGVPLGTLLREHAVEHRRQVDGFFEIPASCLPHGALPECAGARLHGRHSVLVSAAGERMAEVVEILPSAAP